MDSTNDTIGACIGDGRCLEGCTNYYISKLIVRCPYECEWTRCPKCKKPHSRWMLDKQDGFCQRCRLILYSEYVKDHKSHDEVKIFMSRKLEDHTSNPNKKTDKDNT